MYVPTSVIMLPSYLRLGTLVFIAQPDVVEGGAIVLGCKSCFAGFVSHRAAKSDTNADFQD